jgi:hypothetical protein
MKISLVLMCCITHLSGNVSYFDTGYWRIYIQYAGSLKMKRAWKQRTCVFHPHPVFFRIWGGGATFCLAGRWSPLIFLNDEEYFLFFVVYPIYLQSVNQLQ